MHKVDDIDVVDQYIFVRITSSLKCVSLFYLVVTAMVNHVCKIGLYIFPLVTVLDQTGCFARLLREWPKYLKHC